MNHQVCFSPSFPLLLGGLAHADHQGQVFGWCRSVSSLEAEFQDAHVYFTQKQPIFSLPALSTSQPQSHADPAAVESGTKWAGGGGAIWIAYWTIIPDAFFKWARGFPDGGPTQRRMVVRQVTIVPASLSLSVPSLFLWWAALQDSKPSPLLTTGNREWKQFIESREWNSATSNVQRPPLPSLSPALPSC